ncbi:MAG TPA: hypothetical protein VNT52_06920, partial [Acidimicrobiales bacterium]|nr:hypothetical protein [Acidimicrobiales bacterium]
SPPGSLPAHMAVAVSGDVARAGSDVGGRITRIVVVRTDAGYTPDPATAGAGTIVATLCGP